MRVNPGEQCVVVQHLLEVRHDPVGVHRVPGEAAPDLVIHAAPGHRVGGARHHGQRPAAAFGLAGPLGVAEQELQHHRRRELRRPAEPAALGVVVLGQRGHRLVAQRRQARLGRLPAQRRGPLRQRGGDPPGLPDDAVAVIVPGFRHPAHEALEDIAREVGPGIERLALRGHEHRHRPAALAGHRLGGGHVDGVHVGALLAVDLDRHQVLVQQLGGWRILEGLVRHHVAPVAGGIADREQHRYIPRPGLRERLLGPGPPIDRIARVLEQIRAGRVAEPVHGNLPVAVGYPQPAPCRPVQPRRARGRGPTAVDHTGELSGRCPRCGAS